MASIAGFGTALLRSRQATAVGHEVMTQVTAAVDKIKALRAAFSRTKRPLPYVSRTRVHQRGPHSHVAASARRYTDPQADITH